MENINALSAFLYGTGLSDIGEDTVSERLLACNEKTAACGLTLTEAEAKEIAKANGDALRKTGRIDFGGGIADMLSLKFCDSPFISRKNFAETLCELTFLFYEFKNDCDDRFSDEELIDIMKRSFDGVCGGSVDALAEDVMPQIIRDSANSRSGDSFAYAEDDHE